MTGTHKGAQKAARTTKSLYGKNFFRDAGKKGGNPILLKKDVK